MGSWIDRVWEMEPGTPAIGTATALTKTERAILLAYAQGNDSNGVVEKVKLVNGTFKGTHQPQLRAKLRASTPQRMLKRAYELGVLVLEYSGEPPKGVAELMPPDLVEIWKLIADGYNNVEICQRLGSRDGVVRAKVLALGQGMAVASRVGGRIQLASRIFEFGVLEGAQWVQRKEGDGK